MANIDINRRAVIEAHVEACRDAVLSNAVELGRWLNRAKEEQIVPHGEWEEWVRTHAGMSERSAQRLMQAAREIPEGSPLERLGVAKIEALLMLPAAEREAAAEEMGAANLSSRQVWREARERAGKGPDKSDRLDPGEALRMAKAAKEETENTKEALASAKEDLESEKAMRRDAEKLASDWREEAENLRTQLRIQKEHLVIKTVEKVPEDYLEVKRKLAAAEREADRLADELDRAKMGAAKAVDSSPSARILSAIGAFMTEAGSFPEMLRRNSALMDADDWALVLARVKVVRDWTAYMEGAYRGA